MQDLFENLPYDLDMAKAVSRLRELRERAGISQRELARLIEQDASNVRFWENSGKLPRANLLLPISKALGVTVADLIGESNNRRTGAPGGKLGSAFQQALRLPRRQQEKLAEFIRVFVSQHSDNSTTSH